MVNILIGYGRFHEIRFIGCDAAGSKTATRAAIIGRGTERMFRFILAGTAAHLSFSFLSFFAIQKRAATMENGNDQNFKFEPEPELWEAV